MAASILKKENLAKVVFAVWIAIWALFLVRPYIKKDLLKEYGELSSRPLEGKRAYVTGEDLYKFIQSCKEALPGASSYEIAGLEERPHDERRAIYYLYPHVIKPDPDYILVYDKAGFSRAGYYVFMQFDNKRYMLKKNGMIKR